MSTKVYHLPDFLKILPSKPGGEISPHVEELETAFNSWVNEKFGHTRMTSVIYRAEIPLLVASTFPLASPRQLGEIFDYMVAFLFMEKLTDGVSSNEVAAVVDSWIKMVLGRASLEPGDDRASHPWFKIMVRPSKLVPSMKAVVGPLYWPRFVDENKAYAMNVVQEALDRQAHTEKQATRNVQSYTAMRRESIGVRPCFTMILSTRQLYIPDDILGHPIVQEVENAAADMVWIVNDVYSFKKELHEDGALNNLLTVLQRDPETCCLDLQGRLGYAEKLFREAFERFHIYRNKLPLLDSEMKQQVATYADGLIDWVVGNLQWHTVAKRYDMFMSDEDKDHNIMRLESTRARL